MSLFHFNWEISIGSVLQLVIALIAIVRMVNGALRKVTRRMSAMERRIDMMWGWIIIQMTKEQREQYEAWIRQHPSITVGSSLEDE